METIIIKQIFTAVGNRIPRKEFKNENEIEEEQIRAEISFVLKNRNHLKKLLPLLFKKNKKESEDIFYIIREIEAHLYFHDYAYELTGVVFLELLNDMGELQSQDIFRKLKDVNNAHFWNIMHALPYTLSVYKFESSFAADWFYTIGERIKEDLASGDFFKSLDNQSYSFPDEALKILNQYYTQGFVALQMVLGAIILGSIRAAIRNKKISTNIDKIENDLKQSNNVRFRTVYFKSWITSYHRNSTSFEEVFQLIQDSYEGTENEIDESFNISARVITTDLTDNSTIASIIGWYNNAVNNEIPAESKFHVINTIYWFATFDKSEKIEERINKFKSIFANLLPVDVKYTGTWRKIEELLTSLITRKKGELFKDYLEIIIQKSTDSFLELLSKNQFRSLEYYLSGTLANSIFTKLLFSEKDNDRKTAFELFRKLKNVSIQNLDEKPTEELLGKILLEFSRIILLAEGTSKFLLMIEPFYREVNEELTSQFTKEMVFQAINYPDACLDKWKKVDNTSEILKEVIDRATKYFDKLNETQKLPARNCNFYEFTAGAKLERKIQSRALRKGVKDKSVFLSLIKSTQILYGDRWSLQGDAHGEQPQKFQELSYSVEMPRFENIDPEGMVLKRMFINLNLKR